MQRLLGLKSVQVLGGNRMLRSSSPPQIYFCQPLKIYHSSNERHCNRFTVPAFSVNDDSGLLDARAFVAMLKDGNPCATTEQISHRRNDIRMAVTLSAIGVRELLINHAYESKLR